MELEAMVTTRKFYNAELSVVAKRAGITHQVKAAQDGIMQHRKDEVNEEDGTPMNAGSCVGDSCAQELQITMSMATAEG